MSLPQADNKEDEDSADQEQVQASVWAALGSSKNKMKKKKKGTAATNDANDDNGCLSEHLAPCSEEVGSDLKVRPSYTQWGAGEQAADQLHTHVQLTSSLPVLPHAIHSSE